METQTPQTKKELSKETQLIKDVFNSPRMNQYVILFDMLNEPDLRYCTNDYVGVLSDESAYIMQSFKLLLKKGYVELIGKFEKEKLFEVPILKYEEARDYLIDKVMTYMKNQIKAGQTDIRYSEVVKVFTKTLNLKPKTVLKWRLQRIERQLEHYNDDPFFLNIKNKLVEQKDLFRDEEGHF